MLTLVQAQNATKSSVFCLRPLGDADIYKDLLR